MAKTLITGHGTRANLYLVEITVPDPMRFVYRRLRAPTPTEALRAVLPEFPEALFVDVFALDTEYERRDNAFYERGRE